LLPGWQLFGLWLLTLIAAVVESALTFASQSEIEDALSRPRKRDRYLRYLDKGRLAAPVCSVTRLGSAVGFAVLFVSFASGGPGVVVSCLVAVGALAAAELPGRFIGARLSTRVLLVALPLLRLLAFLVEPFSFLSRQLLRLKRPATREEVVKAAKEEIRVAIADGASEGALEVHEKRMIEGILEFKDVEVDQIMTPRLEMECLDVNTPLQQAIQMTMEFSHSRIPVYEETRDRIVGIVCVKDMLPLANRREATRKTLRDIMHAPHFVPETKRIGGLLRDLQKEHVQLAIVVDEYGGVKGLATVEDIVEEIVGEIQDEYDVENHEDRFRRVSPTCVEMDGRLQIREVNDLLGTRIPEQEDYDTIGGFVMGGFAKVPAKGEELRREGMLVRVLDSNERSVRRVLIELLDEEG